MVGVQKSPAIIEIVDGRIVKRRKKRVDKNGNPLKRKTKVLGVLRKELASDAGALDLAPSAARSRLASNELASSLLIHLIDHSNGIVTVSNSPPVTFLNSTRLTGVYDGLNSRTHDAYQEVLVTSLMALGARRSFHSQIVGGNNAVVKGAFGEKREGACRTLVDRTVELIQNSGLLDDFSARAQEAASIARIALFAAHPRHPFGTDLAAYYHQAHKLSLQPNGSRSLSAESGSVLEYDCYVAILTRSPSKISELDLKNDYMWSWSFATQSRYTMLTEFRVECPEVRFGAPGRAVTVAMLRALIGMQQIPTDRGRENFPLLYERFHFLRSFLDDMESGLARMPLTRTVGGESNNTFGSIRFPIKPHLAAKPLILECALANEAKRFCEGEEDEKAVSILATSRLRLLKWIKVFIQLIQNPEFLAEPTANHSRALFLALLDLYPDWVTLLLDAARHHQEGVGEFAEVGLSYSDLFMMRQQFQHASAVFARSARQERELSKAVEALNMKREEMQEAASHIVSKALESLVDDM